MQLRTLQITLTALFAAVIAALTLIPLPFSFLGVPMTLQIFAVAFCGFLTGWKTGLGSVSLYLLLGSIGLPIFSGFQGGFQKLIGPTGGFLYGFLPLVLLCGLSLRFRRPVLRWIFGILLGIAGLLICHFLGSFQLSQVNGIPFWSAVAGASLPFLPKDVLLLVAAFALAFLLRRRLPFLRQIFKD